MNKLYIFIIVFCVTAVTWNYFKLEGIFFEALFLFAIFLLRNATKIIKEKSETTKSMPASSSPQPMNHTVSDSGENAVEKKGIIDPQNGSHPREPLVSDLSELNSENEDTLKSVSEWDLNLYEIGKELERIVGLSEVKERVRAIASQVSIQQLQRELGVDKGSSLHMVFLGNPGTGQTTMAGLVGKLLKELGVLTSGHVIETDRSGMVASHVGQTAPTVHDIVRQALGGVLFIDEADSLADNLNGEASFGREAIHALVKGMKDHRENLIVILAGREKEMSRFLDRNPGVRSRFPHVVRFKDYTSHELYQILETLCAENQYVLDYRCKQKLIPILEKEANQSIPGNGRFVKNLLEKAIRNQAARPPKLLPEDFET